MVSGYRNTHMNPAPPVIIIFFTSGSGSYLVLPVRIGASFHTPKSSKNLFVPLLAAGTGNLRSVEAQRVEDMQVQKPTGRHSVDSIFGGHIEHLVRGSL